MQQTSFSEEVLYWARLLPGRMHVLASINTHMVGPVVGPGHGGIAGAGGPQWPLDTIAPPNEAARA
eukprot:353615-Chlamydomonas_euryale.AAC.4